MKINKIIKTWKEVFMNWKYPLLTTTLAVFFYLVNVVISNWKILFSFYPEFGFLKTINLFFSLVIGFGATLKLSSYMSLLIISVLFGMLFSLITYKTLIIKTTSGKSGVFVVGGIFLGMIAPGCAACGVGSLSLFGLSSAFLVFLPLGGLEISLLAIGILFFSIMKISEDMSSAGTCEINFYKSERRLK
ncbi:hypothetical protein COU60_02510 [Candidatus Pacearchaeota archaeon CG10_big_fil_rev_8_21_14_0_10_34_76]|nr:MAG: hypothetical protein COU60_02510 [Candidatus Pacearchaeota archaeon CG10_big_fil_rev_8_21_14_0_10_34_76]